MQKELHLFILWEKSRHKEAIILQDISKKFEIIKTFNISWSETAFSENLSRLYGKKLQKSNRKKELCGTGDFLMIAVYDHNPEYINGANANIHRAKYKYRQLTGGGHLIHGTDNSVEVEESLIFLLHTTPEEFLQKHSTPWNGRHENIKKEMIGNPWKDEKELISFIKNLPETSLRPIQDTHLIITNDICKICRLLNATKRMFFMKRNMYRIPITGSEKFVYIRRPI